MYPLLFVPLTKFTKQCCFWLFTVGYMKFKGQAHNHLKTTHLGFFIIKTAEMMITNNDQGMMNKG